MAECADLDDEDRDALRNTHVSFDWVATDPFAMLACPASTAVAIPATRPSAGHDATVFGDKHVVFQVMLGHIHKKIKLVEVDDDHLGLSSFDMIVKVHKAKGDEHEVLVDADAEGSLKHWLCKSRA